MRIKMKNIITKMKSLLKELKPITIVLIIGAFLIGLWISNTNAPSDLSTKVHDHGKEDFWTCSMHPSVNLPESGQCPICFMDLIPVNTTNGTESMSEIVLSKDARKIAKISTVSVTQDIAVKKIHLSGKVEYDQQRFYQRASWVAGRVEKNYLSIEGVNIKKGDPVIDIYSPELFIAQQELIQAKKLLNTVNSKSLSANSAKITFQTAQEKLRLMGLLESQIQKVEESMNPFSVMTIYSNYSGYLIQNHVREGEYLKEGTPIVSIADLDTLWVSLDVYESDMDWVQKGQMLEYQFEALPGEIFKGKIVTIDPIINPLTHTTAVKFAFKNKNALLKPGMFVDAQVFSRINSDGNLINPQKNILTDHMSLLIPVSSVLQAGNRSIVYVEEGDTYSMREIVLGPKAEDYYIVKSGLSLGEKVVTKGTFKIDSAMQIAGKFSLMNLPEVKHELSTNSLDPLFEALIIAQTEFDNNDVGGVNEALNALKMLSQNIYDSHQFHNINIHLLNIINHLTEIDTSINDISVLDKIKFEMNQIKIKLKLEIQ